MSASEETGLGKIAWHDLTVANAKEVVEFYAEVMGLNVKETPMGDYCDYTLVHPKTGASVAGVCHARGPNKGIPPQWLTYVTVGNIYACVEKATSLGGKVLRAPEEGGKSTMAIIQDPAGAVLALWTKGLPEKPKA